MLPSETGSSFRQARVLDPTGSTLGLTLRKKLVEIGSLPASHNVSRDKDGLCGYPSALSMLFSLMLSKVFSQG